MADIDMQSTVADEQKLVKKRKIAHRYDVSERTIQEWMDKGKLPFRKIGYMVRFDPEECDRALDRFKN
jgi:excisionase family DNA binding protein